MARTLVFTFRGEDSTFDFARLDRARLYGARKRLVLDRDGEPCRRAELTDDGAYVLQPGMTAQGYFDDHDGAWIPNAQLVGLTEDGGAAPTYPSTLGVAQPLEGPMPPEALLDTRIQTTYMLDPEQLSDALAEALAAGEIFRFSFSYRTDHRSQVGFLVANDHGVFALIGNEAAPAWCELDDVVGDDDGELDDELDFEMF